MTGRRNEFHTLLLIPFALPIVHQSELSDHTSVAAVTVKWTERSSCNTEKLEGSLLSNCLVSGKHTHLRNFHQSEAPRQSR